RAVAVDERSPDADPKRFVSGAVDDGEDLFERSVDGFHDEPRWDEDGARDGPLRVIDAVSEGHCAWGASARAIKIA
ncbi:MAG: hypothetical protein ACHREM_27705, partial [Polyangiales bacterium]